MSENLVSEIKSWFRFWKFWSKKKVSVSENLVAEKSLGFGKFGLEKNLDFGFGEFGLRKRSRFQKMWPRKKSLGKNKNNNKETRPSK